MVPLRLSGFLHGDVRPDAVGHLSCRCRGSPFKPAYQALVEHKASMALGILRRCFTLGGSVLLRVLQRDADLYCAGNYNHGAVPAPELVRLLSHGDHDPAYMPGTEA